MPQNLGQSGLRRLAELPVTPHSRRAYAMPCKAPLDGSRQFSRMRFDIPEGRPEIAVAEGIVRSPDGGQQNPHLRGGNRRCGRRVTPRQLKQRSRIRRDREVRSARSGASSEGGRPQPTTVCPHCQTTPPSPRCRPTRRCVPAGSPASPADTEATNGNRCRYRPPAAAAT